MWTRQKQQNSTFLGPSVSHFSWTPGKQEMFLCNEWLKKRSLRVIMGTWALSKVNWAVISGRQDSPGPSLSLLCYMGKRNEKFHGQKNVERAGFKKKKKEKDKQVPMLWDFSGFSTWCCVLWISNRLPTVHPHVDSFTVECFQGTHLLSYVSVTIFIVHRVCQSRGAGAWF